MWVVRFWVINYIFWYFETLSDHTDLVVKYVNFPISFSFQPNLQRETLFLKHCNIHNTFLLIRSKFVISKVLWRLGNRISRCKSLKHKIHLSVWQQICWILNSHKKQIFDRRKDSRVSIWNKWKVVPFCKISKLLFNLYYNKGRD